MFARLCLAAALTAAGCTPAGGSRRGSSSSSSPSDTVESADDAVGGDTGAPDDDAGSVDAGPGVGTTDTTGGVDTTGTTGRVGCADCPKGTVCVDDTQCCTCTPVGCSEGIDNSLAGLAGLANSSFQDSVDSGNFNVILNYDEGAGELTAFTGVPIDEGCVSEKLCSWALIDDGFDAACQPRVVFDQVTIDGETITASGAEFVPLPLPAAGGLTLELLILVPRFQGTITPNKLSGVLAGAIPKQALAEAVDALPEEGLPISKDAIKNILENVVKADLDVLDADGNLGQDGVMESASVGLVLEAVPGLIEGYSVGVDALCADPQLPAGSAYRVSDFKIGESGKPGQGLDVDAICY